MSLDKSKILIGDDIVINDFITLKQPKVGDVIDFGEQHFFNVFYSLCSIPSNYKSVLWDMGEDWNKMSDWQLFLNLVKGVTLEDTKLIFGDLDFSKFQMYQKNDSEEIVLVDIETNHMIDEQIYLSFIDIIREMTGITVKREKAANKVTKMALIEEDRLNRLHPPKTGDDEPFLFSAIVSLVNTEEFPYTYKSVREITIYQLMKSFYQIQNKKSACALYQGSMSGFIDMSKVDKKNFQWIYTKPKEL